MSLHLIDGEAAAADLRERLAGCGRIGLDLEGAGYHRYSDRICLAQVTAGGADFVLDPFAFDVGALLRPALEDPATEVVMHGASHDLRLLRRDWGIALTSLFDTHVAAELLGAKATGLGALVETRLGISLPKAYQRADWAVRPLPEAMLRYAANDTRHLLALADRLLVELEEAGREAWAREECELLEGAALQTSDPVELAARVKGAWRLPPRQIEALRAALAWRDRIARRRDAAPFRVIGDKPLIEVAVGGCRDASALARMRGFPSALARTAGGELVCRLEEADAVPEGEIAPLERPKRRSVRVRPDLEPAMERAKALRNERARELGISPGRLLSNAAIAAVVRRQPRSIRDLEGVELRRWQVALLGRELVEAVIL